MDLVHDTPQKEYEEEDRISNLPDDIIHRILGFLDVKYAVQTSRLSKRWKHVSTSMPYLNLDFHVFSYSSQFDKFVKHVLSHRNNCTQVSEVKLKFTGIPSYSVFKSIFGYAYSHDVRQLTMIWAGQKYHSYPDFFFSSRTLKHLTLRYENYCSKAFHPTSAWDFPALETLNLTRFWFGKGEDEDKSFNLFSKCVNLKDLTLHRCNMSGVRNFNVCAQQLLNLTFTVDEFFPKVFNVVAPQLENFTASVMSAYDFLRLSTEGLDLLQKVNLSSSWTIENNKRSVPTLLDLFQKLRSTKFLILDAWIVEALSLCMDEFRHEPCPFNKLKCLKIAMTDMAPRSACIHRIDRIVKTVPQVRKYLLKNCPVATFINNLPQVPPMRVKRPMQTVHNYTMANKVAKLDVPTAEVPSASRPSSSDHEKLMSLVIKSKIAELKVKIESGNPDHEVISSKGIDIKSVMELIPENLKVKLEARFSSLYEGFKSMFLALDDSQWAEIETKLEKEYKGFLDWSLNNSTKTVFN